MIAGNQLKLASLVARLETKATAHNVSPQEVVKSKGLDRYINSENDVSEYSDGESEEFDDYNAEVENNQNMQVYPTPTLLDQNMLTVAEIKARLFARGLLLRGAVLFASTCHSIRWRKRREPNVHLHDMYLVARPSTS